MGSWDGSGDAPLGAYQVTFQLWIFLALVLDAVAIAGQIVVGRELGAGRAEEAYRASARMIRLSVGIGVLFAVGLLASSELLPRAFTDDPAVLAQCALAWPVFALMQPLNGAVFALDGILIGAGDGRFIAGAMVASFGVCASALAASSALGWGIRGVWLALVVLVAARLATLGARFLRRRWLVIGWA